MLELFWILLIWVGLNLWAYWLFKRDKALAIEGARRIPESSLLTAAFLGGSLGAKLAQRRFRHKTRKQPFKFYLDMIVALHILLVVWALATWLGLLPSLNDQINMARRAIG